MVAHIYNVKDFSARDIFKDILAQLEGEKIVDIWMTHDEAFVETKSGERHIVKPSFSDSRGYRPDKIVYYGLIGTEDRKRWDWSLS